LSYPRLNIGIYFRRSPVAHAFLPWWHDLDPEPQRQRNKAPAPPRLRGSSHGLRSGRFGFS
jgi:hypothetical protein